MNHNIFQILICKKTKKTRTNFKTLCGILFFVVAPPPPDYMYVVWWLTHYFNVLFTAKLMCDLLLIKMRFVKKRKKNENEFQILEMASFLLLSWTPPPPRISFLKKWFYYFSIIFTIVTDTSQPFVYHRSHNIHHWLKKTGTCLLKASNIWSNYFVSTQS